MLVREIPMLEDNYGYLLCDLIEKEAAAIDPVEPEKVLAAASAAGVTITTVLTTHKHWDHAGGNNGFHKQCPEVPILGGVVDAVEGCTKPLQDGDMLTVGKNIQVQCLHTPGHTMGHICYLATSKQEGGGGGPAAVFTGDTLFIGGAGKFFEGTPQDMYTSLYTKLATLPPETQVWCGHEYTVSNYRFAEWMEPKNVALQAAITEAKARRAQGLPTVPSTIAQELATNPFLRVEETVIQEKVAAESGLTKDPLDPVFVLGKVRELKNNF